jgi:hypothetical protein
MAPVRRQLLLLVAATTTLPPLSSGVSRLPLEGNSSTLRQVANKSDVANVVFDVVRNTTASFAHRRDEIFGRFLSSCAFLDRNTTTATVVASTQSNDGGDSGGADSLKGRRLRHRHSRHGRNHNREHSHYDDHAHNNNHNQGSMRLRQGNTSSNDTNSNNNNIKPDRKGHIARYARPDRIFVAQDGSGGGGIGNLLLKLK